jgi:photosystem II stability/assembly factor-like uncharacterized protein
MKLILWSVALLLCTASTVFAEGWEWIWPLPQGNDLNDIQFVGNARGFAAGEFGTLLTTTDSGVNWEAVNTNLPGNIIIFRIRFYDELHGCLFGKTCDSYYGYCQSIFWTGDGGVTWSEQLAPDSTAFRDIAFADRLNGVVVGWNARVQHSVAFRTVDGGLNWNEIDFDFGGAIYQVILVNRTFGYIRSDSAIWRTTDLGLTWNQVTCPGTPAAITLSFCNELWGYADADNGLYRTTDGGQTWLDLPDPYSGRFTGITFINPSVGVGFANHYESVDVYTTLDGGYNWTNTNPFGNRELRAIINVGVSQWWAVGTNGLTASSSDAGVTWQVSGGSEPPFIFIAPSDSLHLWAVTPGQLLIRSTDGGDSYDTLVNAPSRDIRDVFFTTPTKGWIVGDRVLYHSTDAGNSWQTNYTLPYADGVCRDFNAYDSLNITFGYHYRDWDYYERYDGIGRTTNGGVSWSLYSLNENEASYNTLFIDQNFGWGGGYDCQVMRTTTGPESNRWYSTWNSWDHGMDWIGGMCAIDSLRCWTWGPWGGPFETRDGGVTWTQIDSLCPYSSVVFGRGGRCGMISEPNLSRFSSDSGNTWSTWPRQVSVNSNFRNTRMSADGDIWAMNYRGCIRRFRPPRTPTSVSEPIVSPANYRLAVFPNPFNASATLQFVLPARSGVTIQVYDILGRCAFAKDLGVLESGIHLERFDASQWTSGIYFAKLSAGNFTKTQKMVLLR